MENNFFLYPFLTQTEADCYIGLQKVQDIPNSSKNSLNIPALSYSLLLRLESCEEDILSTCDDSIRTQIDNADVQHIPPNLTLVGQRRY